MQVIDVNDEAPAFQREEFEAQVMENQGPGTTVLRVSAVDRDQGGFNVSTMSPANHQMSTSVILFLLFGACVATGSNGHVTYGGVTEDGFVINPVTGVITTTKELDSEAQDHYTLTGTDAGVLHVLQLPHRGLSRRLSSLCQRRRVASQLRQGFGAGGGDGRQRQRSGLC